MHSLLNDAVTLERRVPMAAMPIVAPALTTLGVDQYAALAEAAAEAGVEVGGDPLLIDGRLVPLLGALVLAGGTWTRMSGAIEWETDEVQGLTEPEMARRLKASGVDGDCRTRDRARWVVHGRGCVVAQLDGRRILLAGVQFPHPDPRVRRPGVVLLGARLAELTGFLRRVEGCAPRPRVRIWGGAVAEADPAPVGEDEVVLPPAHRTSLLAWLDRFWARRAMAAGRGLPLRRGVLLVGPPGTGKTQFVRHLITRYSEASAHLFLPSPRGGYFEDPFGAMVVELREATDGALVVLEDIDRLAESRVVPPSYMLNCLDGLLTLPHPVLWVATANDPTLLDKNLLERPGRFDRVVSFDYPAAPQRELLLARFAALPLAPRAMARAVGVSDGLSGAHLRAAAASALLESDECGTPYDTAVVAELERLRRELHEARAVARSLGAPVAGFRPAAEGA